MTVTYVVFFSGTMDDIPLLLTQDEDEAFELARSITGVDDPRVEASLGIIRRDVGTQHSTAVASFVDGRLTGWRRVKGFAPGDRTVIAPDGRPILAD